MDCIYIVEARYVKEFTIHLKFNTGEAGTVDLKDIIYKHSRAKSLRNTANFEKFYLDSWPTLAWRCGFDIAPESLYFRATGKKIFTA